MPTTLTLSSGTSVARTGSTDNWPGLPTLPASSGPYNPGDKSEYARFKITPTSPLVSLPPYFNLTVTADVDPDTADANVIINDYVAIGPIGGPLTANVATNVAVPAPPTQSTYDIPTSALVLATLNAGNYYLYLGWKSLLTTSYTLGSFTFTITPTSPQTSTQVETLSLTTDFQVTWDYPGTNPAYVIAKYTGTSKADSDPYTAGYPIVGTASTNNGCGGTNGGVLHWPYVGGTHSYTAGPTDLKGIIYDLQAGTITMQTDVSVKPNQEGIGTHTLTVTAVQPTASTLNLDALSLISPDTGSAVFTGVPNNNSIRVPAL